MKDEFGKYIIKNQLFTHADKLLVAVSGGIDSVAMLHLLVNLGYECAIINCNFQLRGVESDEDQEFVVSLAEKYRIPAFSNKFNTGEYAHRKGISIQMAARELRYNWFEEIRQKFDYQYIVVAHQRDDIVETFHINLTRGTGIRGITGIKAKNGYISRPMLFASRKEIEKYVKENHLQYREDSSNSTTKYARNKIRHVIIPAFERINPSYQQSIFECSNRLREIEEVYMAAIEEKRNLVVQKKEDKILIKIDSLLQLSPLQTYLYEFLSPYSFVPKQIEQIAQAIYETSGKQFSSHTHHLLRDREYLIIMALQPKYETEKEFYFSPREIEEDEQIIKQIGGKKWKFSIIYKEYDFEINTSPTIAQLDFENLESQLCIRHWQEGDSFHPLGMNGKKKISDFLIDTKIPLTEKNSIWVVLSGENIAWLAEKRIDNRFRITEHTRKILQIEVK